MMTLCQEECRIMANAYWECKPRTKREWRDAIMYQSAKEKNVYYHEAIRIADAVCRLSRKQLSGLNRRLENTRYNVQKHFAHDTFLNLACVVVSISTTPEEKAIA